MVGLTVCSLIFCLWLRRDASELASPGKMRYFLKKNILNVRESLVSPYVFLSYPQRRHILFVN